MGSTVVDYVLAKDVAEHLMEDDLLDGEEGTYEPVLDSLVTRASDLVDKWFGQDGGFYKAPAASARYFDGNGMQELHVGYMADAPTEVAVAEAGILATLTVYSASDYIVKPYNASDQGRPYTSLYLDTINGTRSIWYAYPKAVKITAQWGWSLTVPPVIEEAVIVQCARWFKRGQQAFQDAGAVTELMSLRYLKKLDPEVELILKKMPGGITI